MKSCTGLGWCRISSIIGRGIQCQERKANSKEQEQQERQQLQARQ